MPETRAQESKRLIAERDAIVALLAPIGQRLHGWNTADSFSAYPRPGMTAIEWNPSQVAVLRDRAVLLEAARAVINYWPVPGGLTFTDVMDGLRAAVARAEGGA